ncbi:MAG: hypothetical protein HXX10_06180 [Rhodoplanes sp.]|uniref:hypothetical protein n=1 Tax=Rhodoplanes sp. TaxID=1968906 RepID=UPI00183BBFD2|nr:hypothetical protein [Rhodoplanes sp.]NVO13607.1 hypothetical protein [Rhodoplanes sp.]
MRFMNLPDFPRKIEILDVDHLLRSRFDLGIVMWPEHAIPLLGYMCHPNDLEPRDDLYGTLWEWSEDSGARRPTIPLKLGRIQHEWLRVADVFDRYRILLDGQHQERRGGPSIGKAITLVEAKARSRGTVAATLWKLWAKYKDVAHLVTAATMITVEVRHRFPETSFGQLGLDLTRIGPFEISLLLPDLVLAAGMTFERLGLSLASETREEPALDPETLWRIRPDMNVVPVSLPVWELGRQDLAVLNDRRAGNRGSAQRKTTPVSG